MSVAPAPVTGWVGILPDYRALLRSNHTTTRREWRRVYREERVEQRRIVGQLVTGEVGSIYGFAVIETKGPY